MKKRSRNYFDFKKGTGFFGIIPTLKYSIKEQWQTYDGKGIVLTDLNNMVGQLKNTNHGNNS